MKQKERVKMVITTSCATCWSTTWMKGTNVVTSRHGNRKTEIERIQAKKEDDLKVLAGVQVTAPNGQPKVIAREEMNARLLLRIQKATAVFAEENLRVLSGAKVQGLQMDLPKDLLKEQLQMVHQKGRPA